MKFRAVENQDPIAHPFSFFQDGFGKLDIIHYPCFNDDMNVNIVPFQ